MKKEEMELLISWLNEQLEFTNKLKEQANQSKNYGKEVQYQAMHKAFSECLNHLPKKNFS
jgi:hypothetical protein